MSAIRSIKPGDTLADRVILEVTDAEDPTPDPSATENGYHLNGADFLHVYTDGISAGTITAATVTPWYYSKVAEKWFEGDPLNFTVSDQFALCITRGEEKVFFVVDSITGAGTLKLYAGYNHDHGRDN